MDEDNIVFFIFGVFFAGIGLLMLIAKIVGRVKTRSNCTERVMATCIRLEKMSDNPDLDPEERAEIEQEEAEERKVQIEIMATSAPSRLSADGSQQVHPLAPVYKIIINGQQHELRSTTYSFPCTTQVGDMRELYVNPNKPSEYFDPKEQRTALIEILAAIGTIGMGVLFMVVGLGLLD